MPPGHRAATRAGGLRGGKEVLGPAGRVGGVGWPRRDRCGGELRRRGELRQRSARLGSARLGSARLGSARLGSARLGSARLGSARLGSARLGSARLGSARLGSARLGSARLGSARLSLWEQPDQSAFVKSFFESFITFLPRRRRSERHGARRRRHRENSGGLSGPATPPPEHVRWARSVRCSTPVSRPAPPPAHRV